MEIFSFYNNLIFSPSGNYYSDLVRNSSVSYLKKLLINGLITIDNSDKVFLTIRGRAAIKMGVKKYLQSEKFEKELKNSHTENVENYLLLVIMAGLVFLFALILGYISWKVDFQ